MFLNIWVPSLVSKYDTWGGSRTKVLPYTNFYVEVLTQFRIKLLHLEQGSIFRLMWYPLNGQNVFESLPYAAAIGIKSLCNFILVNPVCFLLGLGLGISKTLLRYNLS